MPGRIYNNSSNGYKYSFNGKEDDKDISEGAQDYGMRIYDKRIQRFFSIDPLTTDYPELTPYQFASNRPIDGIDLDGCEYRPSGRYNGLAVDGTSLKMSPLDPTVMDQINGRIQLANVNDAIAKSNANQPSFSQAPKVVSEATKKARKEHYMDPESGKKTALGKLYLNKTYEKLNENIVEPIANMAVGEIVGGFVFNGILSKVVSSRINLASDFYSEAGFTTKKALEHMEGIDFSKAVKTTTLKKGTIIQQWVGENGVGSYFTPLENGANKNLGISYEGRTLKQFTLTEDVKVLKSTAADYKGNAGGGTQYFNPELKTKVTPNE